MANKKIIKKDFYSVGDVLTFQQERSEFNLLVCLSVQQRISCSLKLRTADSLGLN